MVVLRVAVLPVICDFGFLDLWYAVGFVGFGAVLVALDGFGFAGYLDFGRMLRYTIWLNFGLWVGGLLGGWVANCWVF